MDHQSARTRCKRFTFISLFAGIGGIDLGLERAGFRCVAQVEIDPFCRRVLAKHWPRVPKFTDIRHFTRSDVHEQPDLVAGGFPCQDISCAGRGGGIEGARSGLWKEMLRVIRSFRPPAVLVENVPTLRSRGLGTVLWDLAASGYDAQWDCLPAAAFGAPHLRDRIFIVAYAGCLRRNAPAIFDGFTPHQHGAWAPKDDGALVEIAGRAYRRYPEHLRVGHGIPHPVERVRGCGNAVVPPAAEWVGRRIKALLSPAPRPALRSRRAQALRPPRLIRARRLDRRRRQGHAGGS